MKQNKIQGYDVKDKSLCRWCTNFIPFSGNGRKICRLYELGRCKFEDGRITKKTTESTKTQMKSTKKPTKRFIKLNEDTALDAGIGDAEPMTTDPMLNPSENDALTKILTAIPEFAGFLNAVSAFVDANMTADPMPSADEMLDIEPVVTEADRALSVGPSNATFEIDWVSNSDDERAIVKEVYATGLSKNVKVSIVDMDGPGNGAAVVRLTGDTDVITKWIIAEYDPDSPADEIEDMYRVYDNKVSESTVSKNLGKRYARLDKRRQSACEL